MDRKYLQNIEEEELSEENSALFLLTDEGISFLATTVEIAADDPVLGIMLYAKNLVKQGIRKPSAVVYIDGNDYAVRYLRDDKGAERKTWGTAEFGRVVKKTNEYFNGYHEMYRTCLLRLSDAGKIVSCIGAEKHHTGISVWKILDSYACAINRNRREKKADETGRRIDALMKENILPVPEDFQKFADIRVSAGIKRKLYAAVDGKKRTTSYFCTKCGKMESFRTKERPYNVDKKGTMVCPMCGKRLPSEKLDRRHSACDFSGWYAFVQPTEAGFVLRTFSKTKRMKFCFSEGRFLLEDDGLHERGRSFYTFRKGTWKVQRYEYEWRSSGGIAWYRSYRNGEVSKSGRAGSYYGQLEYTGLCLYGDADLYTGNYRTAFAKTPLKYNDLRDIAKVAAKGGMRCADAVLQTLCEFPKLEWILKMGLYDLAGYLSYGYGDDVLNIDGKTIYDILGIGKAETKLLQKCGGSAGALRAIRMFKEYGTEARNEKQVAFVSKLCGFERRYCSYSAGYKRTECPDGTFFVRRMLQNGVSVDRTENYLKKEIKNGTYDDINDFCSIYKDYYQMAEKLGKDFSNRWWLMPNHLQSAHDNISREMEQAKERILERESRRLNDILAELSKLKAEAAETDDSETYTAVFPSTIEEYRTDGDALHQCIYTCGYYEKVARGESEIAFIRRKSEPDVPFATLEWRGDKILQLRGYGNGSVPKDVWDYAESLVKRINAFEEHVA